MLDRRCLCFALLGSYIFADSSSAMPTFTRVDEERCCVSGAAYDFCNAVWDTCRNTAGFASAVYCDRELSQVGKAGSSVFTGLASCTYQGGLVAGCVTRDVAGIAEAGLDYFVRESSEDSSSRLRADKFVETCAAFSDVKLSTSLLSGAAVGLLHDRDRESLVALGVATGYVGYTVTRASLCVTRDTLRVAHDFTDFVVSGSARRSVASQVHAAKKALSDPIGIARSIASYFNVTA